MVTNNQINTSLPIGIASGGTGVSSFTAYSLIAAGTTSTGPLQSAGTGTSGQFYVSNGSSSLGTFRSFKVIEQVFTSNGTYTPTTGLQYCKIRILGGGGAGGGAAASGVGPLQVSSGSGGGSGEYAEGVFSAATIGASQAITIGAAGAGVLGLNGGNGGNSSVGALISANGGIGGILLPAASVATFAEGGLGGTGGSGGSFRTPGSAGLWAITFTGGGVGIGGQGASSQFGAGGLFQNNTNGAAALGYGAGGGGAESASGFGPFTGGNGTAGIVVVTEFVIAV